jgi:hypothetical protein
MQVGPRTHELDELNIRAFVALLAFLALRDCENNRNNFTHVRVHPVIHSRNKLLFTRL